MRRVVKTGTCWIWTGAKVGIGYGVAHADGRQVLVHRYLWEHKNGPVPVGLECGHRCPDGARPDCVNPDHIEAITHAENVADRWADLCARRLHRLSDPHTTGQRSDGKRYCRPCRSGYRSRVQPATSADLSSALVGARRSAAGE